MRAPAYTPRAMNTEPLAFLKNEIPAHFAKGIAALQSATGPSAKESLDDVVQARGAIRIIVEGSGEAWLAVEKGKLNVADAKPSDLPSRAVISFAADAAKEALSLLSESGRLSDPKAPERFARMFSARAEKILESQKLEFHVIIKDVPDRAGDVVIKIGIGTDQVPQKPQFTAAISYDDLEDMREGDITPNQVIGRLRLTGDASRAMALGMMLMQPPKK